MYFTSEKGEKTQVSCTLSFKKDTTDYLSTGNISRRPLSTEQYVKLPRPCGPTTPLHFPPGISSQTGVTSVVVPVPDLWLPERVVVPLVPPP